MTTALRSFLRFARYRGAITLDLAACVPSVANWSLSTLPKSMPPAHVKAVLARGCQRSTASGRRDYAILLLLARLGLRGGEVCRLTLDDVDWKHSRNAIRGKGDRAEPLAMISIATFDGLFLQWLLEPDAVDLDALHRELCESWEERLGRRP